MQYTEGKLKGVGRCNNTLCLKTRLGCAEHWVSHNGLDLFDFGLVQLVVLLSKVGKHCVNTQVVLLKGEGTT